MLDKLAEDEAGDVLRAVVERAKAGDADCARIVLSRCWPPRRARIKFTVPPMNSAADLPAAISTVLQQVSSGMLTQRGGVLAQIGTLPTQHDRRSTRRRGPEGGFHMEFDHHPRRLAHQPNVLEGNKFSGHSHVIV